MHLVVLGKLYVRRTFDKQFLTLESEDAFQWLKTDLALRKIKDPKETGF